MTIVLQDADLTVYHADVLDALAELADESVDCVATSPPYWGLRDYKTGDWSGGDPECDHSQATAHQAQGATSLRTGRANIDEQRNDNFRDRCGRCGASRIDRQIGLEPTPAEYVASLVAVFREIRRVLAAHGTVWLNLGDSYVSDPGKGGSGTPNGRNNRGENYGRERMAQVTDGKAVHGNVLRPYAVEGLKQKDLVGIPWRVAFALQDDGWWLRAENIWDKCNPMPESVRDRPTKAHEQVFLLTKSARYFYDKTAVAEPAEWARWGDQTTPKYDGEGETKSSWIQARTASEVKRLASVHRSAIPGGQSLEEDPSGTRNMRSVWRIPTSPNTWAACEDCDAVFDKTKDAMLHRDRTGHNTTGHFAAFPPDLVRRCILAGCPREVCTACGKPRERLTEDTPMVIDRSERTHDRGQTRSSGTMLAPIRSEHVGWSDCGCGASFRQGVALDPFLGSGTTAVVAREEGRACVGIELSEPYTRIILRRLHQQSIFPEITA